MRQLMGDECHETFVAGENRRRNETEARIFHATKRKARWQDQQVVAIPAIRTVNVFGNFEHGFGVFEFRRISIKETIDITWKWPLATRD